MSIIDKALYAAIVLTGSVAIVEEAPNLWTNEIGAAKAVASEPSGLTSVHTTGYRWLGCDKGDLFHTGFTAVNAQGKRVSGVVCSGLSKGNRVRYDLT